MRLARTIRITVDGSAGSLTSTTKEEMRITDTVPATDP